MVAGTAANFVFVASGIPAPTLSETGTLPSGLTFTNNGNGTATLSGMPAAGTGGSYSLIITAHNGIGTDATQSFTLTVNQIATVTSASSATFAVGAGGSFSVTAAGYPAAILSESGALPTGVTFTSATGILAGTPAAGTGGSYAITFTAHNGIGADATQSFTLNVNQDAAITSPTGTTAISFTVGTAGTLPVTATGMPTPALSETGTLPNGLSFVDNKNGTGTLAGTPATGTVGSYPITFTAHNSAGPDSTQSVTLTVNKATPSITWPAPAAITYGTALGATQLDASASVPGTFAYTPAAGTVPSTGSQTLSVTFTPTDTVDYTTASKSVTISVGQTTPVITWPAPAAITYGAALGATQLDATASVPGTFVYTPAAGAVLTAGSQMLSATFTPTDSTDYSSATRTVTLVVNQATASVTLGSLAQTYDGTPKAASASSVPSGLSVSFSYSGASGTVYGPSATAPTSAGAYTVSATVSDPNYSGSGSATLIVSKATPIITWPTPAAITYGTMLGATQLDASASVPGTFAYTPAAGTVPSTGSQTLSVTFTPTDTVDYTTASKSVTISVGQTTPVITWPAPAAITYGAALGATQLDATASVPGTFVYTPAAGAVLTAGSQTLSATFTPTDSTDYSTATRTVTLVVNQAAASVTLGSLAQTYDGTPKAASASSVPSGLSVSFSYSGASGTVYGPSATAPTSAGAYTVSATVSDPNYSGSGSATLIVSKATPIITWPTPAAITYGTMLGATQLDASASVPGTFAYTPAAGTVPSTGSQTLSVTFTPTDTVDYTTASKSVTISVGQTTPVITWPAPAAITYGAALGATQLDATASVPGTFVYTPAAGAVLTAGSQMLSATFTPTDSTDYSTATRTVTLVVNQAAASVTLGSLAQTYDGTPKAASASSVPSGLSVSFSYSGASGTVYGPSATAPTSAGTYTVSATVSDPNYSGSGSATLIVSKATPIITWPTPAAITYGTMLGATQLDASASVPGTFAYTPAAGTVPSTGSQTLSVTFTPTDTVDYTTASKSVTISVGQTTPVITWPAPAAITYGAALGATQLDATASVPGTFVYTPAAGAVLTAGSQTLSATFTPTDSTDYSTATRTVTLVVNQAAASVTLGSLAQTYDGTPKAASASSVPSGLSVSFSYSGASGTVYGPSATAPTSAGTYTVSATVSDPNYSGSGSATLIVSKATPIITWPTPAAITYGTMLGATQLDASASVPGTFAYTPAAGTVPSTGSQTLSVTFTPTDTVDYTTASKSVTISVGQTTPVITWPAPAAITYGAALGATQLDATASVPGTFAYTPAAGTVLAAGSQTLSATFTPTDSTDYSTATRTVTLVVNQATASVTLGSLAQTYDGTPKAASASSVPSGLSVSFSYSGASGTVYGPSATAPTSAGAYTVSATVSDPNYSGSGSATLIVSKATPIITWPTPAAITYGTMLGATQLDASASVPGTFAYTPAAGTVLAAGNQTLSVTFTPTDTVDYTSTTGSVTITVGLAALVTNASNTTFSIGVAGSFAVTATGFPAPILSESGVLPTGVSFDSTTGVLSGTPAAGTGGTYPLEFTAHNGIGADATQIFYLLVESSGSGYAYYRTITIDHTKVPNTDQLNFPVLISGTYPYLATTSNGGNVSSANGYDILFAADAGGTTPLAFEQESYSPITGAVTYWVQVPTLSHTTDTVIYLFYGNPAVTTDQSNKTGVWDSNYQAVWHMNDNAANTTVKDSTSNGYNGTAVANTSGKSTTGEIGHGLSFNGTSDGITTSLAPTNVFTWEGWFNASSMPSYGSIIVVSGNYMLMQVESGTATIFMVDYSGHESNFGITGLTTGTWYHMVLSRSGDSGTYSAYLNGSLMGTLSSTTWSNTNYLQLGERAGYSQFFAGTLDELRVSNIVRSADWISAEYNNQNSPSTFYSVGSGSSLGPDLAPTITSANSVTFTANTAGSFTVTATGVPTPILSGAGVLPSGLAFNPATGILSGTPAAGTAGNYSITFTAHNSLAPDAIQSFMLTVGQGSSAPIINSPSSTSFAVGAVGSFIVTSTGSPAPTLSQSGALPSGITLNTATGVLGGTPAAGTGGSYPLTFTAQNGVPPDATQDFTLTINSAPSIVTQPTNQTVAAGEEATFTVTISDTGALPLNFQWLENNMIILGATSQSYTTPVTTQADSGAQFSVLVTNALGTAPSAAATLTVVPATSPATYYVDFSSGVDTNSGVTKDAPWQYAPGMNACAFNCALIVPQPGDQVIFKGGVTWDATGFPMVVGGSGATGNAIYYGVDQTWFAGTTWSRPVFDLYDATWSVAPILVSAANFVTFDNLEIKNEEVDESGSWPPRGSIAVDGGSNITIQNCYIHGWSIQNPGAGSDSVPTGGIAFYDGSTGGVVQNCVLDGSPESDSGMAIYGGSSIQGNIIEDVPNGIFVTDPAAIVSGNQVFDVPYSVDPSTSSNAIFAYSSGSIHNNVVHDIVPGASALFLEAGTYQLGNTQYVYNNLVWNVGDDSPIAVASDGLGPSSTSNQFIYNNTLSGGTTAGCIGVIPSSIAPTNLTVQNNHCISESPASQAWCWNNSGGNFNCGSVTNLIFGNNVLMTTEAAASQGYTLTSSFQPTAPNGATVGAGLNLLSTCVTVGSSLCSDILGVLRPGGSAAWDAGAYQYQSQTSGSIAPVIIVQPVRQSVTQGHTATFSVIAAGTAPLFYQWQNNGMSILGATSSTYTTPVAMPPDDGTAFTVVVSNTVGGVTSSPAILSVNSAAGQLTANPAGLSFGLVNVGTATAASVALTNMSSSYITISNVSVSGPGFNASGVPSGIILAPGEIANLNVVFAPSGLGDVTGSATINSDAAGSPIVIPLSASGVAPPHSVGLAWDPSTSPIFGYNVYRATVQNGLYTQYARLTTIPIITLQYTDLAVQPGQTYVYWVMAVASDTVESVLSDPVVVTIPNGIAPSNYSISGQITLSSQGGGAGATVTLTAASTGAILASTTTDSSGNFTLTEIPNGSYVVTPSSPTAVFTPASLNVTISGASYTTANFTAASLAFYDDFTGTSLSPAWTVISRHGQYAQNEKECNVPQMVSVANSNVAITTEAQRATCGDFNIDGTVRNAPMSWLYITGDIQWTGLNFTYGTIEIRAKFPSSASNLWPATWLLGSNCQVTKYLYG